MKICSILLYLIFNIQELRLPSDNIKNFILRRISIFLIDIISSGNLKVDIIFNVSILYKIKPLS